MQYMKVLTGICNDLRNLFQDNGSGTAVLRLKIIISSPPASILSYAIGHRSHQRHSIPEAKRQNKELIGNQASHRLPLAHQVQT